MLINLTGRVFGRLVVKERADNFVSKSGHPYTSWICVCSCGKEKRIASRSLLAGLTKSCGCLVSDTFREIGLHINKTHGGASIYASVDDHIKFGTLQQIRRRARKNGYETDLEMSDLPILTDSCPALGITYKKSKGPLADETVSIDKVNPNLPYLKKYKDNLVFLSYKANRIKNNASLDELKSVVKYVESNLRSHSEESENLL
jgi:hypothetical protein